MQCCIKAKLSERTKTPSEKCGFHAYTAVMFSSDFARRYIVLSVLDCMSHHDYKQNLVLFLTVTFSLQRRISSARPLQAHCQWRYLEQSQSIERLLFRSSYALIHTIKLPSKVAFPSQRHRWGFNNICDGTVGSLQGGTFQIADRFGFDKMFVNEQTFLI